MNELNVKFRFSEEEIGRLADAIASRIERTVGPSVTIMTVEQARRQREGLLLSLKALRKDRIALNGRMEIIRTQREYEQLNQEIKNNERRKLDTKNMIVTLNKVLKG